MDQLNLESIVQQKNLSIKQASNMLGKSEQYIRIGLRNQNLPFGTAVKTSTHWTYHISPISFYEYLGLIKIEEKTFDELNANNLSLAGQKLFLITNSK